MDKTLRLSVTKLDICSRKRMDGEDEQRGKWMEIQTNRIRRQQNRKTRTSLKERALQHGRTQQCSTGLDVILESILMKPDQELTDERKFKNWQGRQ